jgi:hypothetical protein
LEVDLEDEGVLQIDLLRNLPDLEGLLFLLDNLLDVLRNFGLHFVLLLVDQSIVEGIGAGQSGSSEGLLDLRHVYLAHPLVVEDVPPAVFEGFYVAEVVAGIGSPRVHQNCVELVDQRSILERHLNELSVLALLLL